MAPKNDKSEYISTLTAKIFSAMADDLILDAALKAHHDVAQSKSVCEVCHTRCSSVHTAGPSTLPATQATASNGNDVPQDAKPVNGSSGPSSNIGSNAKSEGTIYLECTNCSRQIASSRYAAHLASCLQLGSSRRGASRNSSKSKQPTETAPSPSSSDGENSDEPLNGKGKAKLKGKRSDEAEFNLKRKRQNSPQMAPNKRQKQKPSASPVARVKSDSDVSGVVGNHQPTLPSLGSPTKIPSKLRDSSTALDKSASPPSRASSQSIPSSFAKGKGPPLRRPSPPRPAPLPVHYIQDDGGEETGSSTDSESS